MFTLLIVQSTSKVVDRDKQGLPADIFFVPLDPHLPSLAGQSNPASFVLYTSIPRARLPITRQFQVY